MRQISSISIGLTAAFATLCVAPAVSAKVSASASAKVSAKASAKTYCPRVLHRATRLIIVTAPTMDATKAVVRTFARKSPAATWTAQSTAEPAVVGASGIAWGHPFVSYAKTGEPIKQEGDKRSPAGLYRLGATFGFAKEDRPGHMQLAPGAQFCVHDPKSPLYGRIVARSKVGENTGGEDMGTFPLYKRGIVIDYAPRARAKAGSCIFLHVWGGEGVGTAGCVALPEERVVQLQEWTKGRYAVIAIVSEDTAARFGACLPSDRVASAHKGPVALPLPNPKRGNAQRAELSR
jgi:L,D-peptidoglycan transpeptidase YkuD (ErfK/YbiS/YcfS/YnhG family)